MRSREQLRATLPSKATGITPAYLNGLQVEQQSERDWRVLTEFRFDSAVLGGRIIVDPGFVTDFASVPRVPVAWLLAGAKANGPATLHDWLYAYQATSREIADKVFLEACLTDGTAHGQPPLPLWTATLMYHAVLQWGRVAWQA